MIRFPRNKYHAKRIEIDGIKFDSQGEAKRYAQLKLAYDAGAISDLYFHRRWPLYVYETTPDSNGVEHIVSHTCIGYYESDFDYVDLVTMENVIEDYKGFQTDIFKWKWKHMQAQYPNYSYRIVR